MIDGLTNNTVQIQEAMKSIAALRQKLLDLSNRNKLLNFTHSPRGRAHLRIVDEIPAFLVTELLKGEDFKFKSLPEPDKERSIPKDEQTDEFESELDQARIQNLEFVSRCEKLENQYGDGENDPGFLDATSRLERWLRDQVREKLGLPQIKKLPLDPLAVARSNGINPTYDLPAPSSTETKPAHFDSFMQTLLLADDLEPRLSSIFDLATQAISEKGVNTLYVAVGFLEWFESNDSEKPLFAPLVLLPAEMEKQVENGKVRFLIRALGDDLQHNITLAARLKQDFQIIIPELAEDEHVEDYFKRVAEAVATMPRWRVRRYVTIGHFAFARLVMYNDLNEERWPTAGKPSAHVVARRMFGGSNAGDGIGFREIYNPDDEQYDISAPPLVVDADSSQFSAIIDVLKGDNLVIQGPPGTGKSQTITNIIAAAIEQGKTVLFVAEKMAALNVVMSRLENVGLGNFSLELHSTKAKKQTVMEALQRRIAMRPLATNPSRARIAISELREAKQKLNTYLQLLKHELGDTQKTVSQVLWRAHIQPETELSEPLRKISLGKAELWTPNKISAVRQRFHELAEIGASLGDSPAACEWNWLTNHTITPVDFPIVEGHVHGLVETLGFIQLTCRELEKLTGIALPQSKETLQRILDEIGKLEIPTLASDARAFEAMVDPATTLQVSTFKAVVEELSKMRSELGCWMPEAFVPTQRSIEILENLEDRVSKITFNTFAEIHASAEASATRAAEVEALSTFLDRFARLLRVQAFQKNARMVDALVISARLVSEMKDEIVADRSKLRIDGEAPAIFENLTTRFAQLKQEGAVLANWLKVEFQTVQAAHVALHRKALEKYSIFGFLFSDYRAARKYLKSLYEEGKVPSNAETLADLSILSDYIGKRDEFFSAPEFVGLFSTHAKGFDSDFDRLGKIIDWAQKVRRALRPEHPLSQAITDYLFESAPNELAELKELLSEPSLDVADEMALKHRSQLDEIDGTPSRLRTTAVGLSEMVRLADNLGLSRDQKLGELGTIRNTIANYINSSTQLASVSARILGRFGADSADEIAQIVDRVSGYRVGISNARLPMPIKNLFLSSGGLERIGKVRAALPALNDRLARFASEAIGCLRFSSDDLLSWETAPFDSLHSRFRAAQESTDRLPYWCTWLRTFTELQTEDVDELLSLMKNGTPAQQIVASFEHIAYRSMARRALELFPPLRCFNGATLTEAQDRIRKLDKKMLDYAQEKVIAEVWAHGQRAPSGNGYGSVKTYTELSLIRHEVGKKTRHIPLRDLLARAGSAIQMLKPCFMMSPMSVAQFLKNDGIRFDIVIFDEASQVLPEDAIGAIVRGSQLIVVGDQMQLPPTDFFQKAETGSVDDMDEEEGAAIQGMESILDKALSVFQPARRLLWHYRSRDPRLIAFSNHEFYDNALQLFPTPNSADEKLGVKIVQVDGLYSGRCNVAEAHAIAMAAVDFMRRYPSRSLGLVALNGQQRDLIAAKVDRLIADDSQAADYCKAWAHTLEPFFVKNLENVQGDERDVIFISTVFGRHAKGVKPFQRFGPINSAVGHRRLNVLFTRAKETVAVFTSLRPEDIQVDEGSSRGRRVLRGYLEYARTNRLEAGKHTGREPDSDFEEMVRNRLRIEGYEVDCQIGVAGYFVDLAVRHPQRSTYYLLGVECDGATYHSFKCARDRDRLRQEILEKLGWNIHRIWSTDWFQNPEREMKRLIERIHSEEKTLLAEPESHLDFSLYVSVDGPEQGEIVS